MKEKEDIIKLWFKMWLKKQNLGIDNIFSDNAEYVESYGVKYESLAEIISWFTIWNEHNSVLEWNIIDFWHKADETIVIWYFKCCYNNNIDEFEGNSIIHWNNDLKIDYLKEFACKLPQINPYRE